MAKQVKRRIIFHIDMNCFYAAVEMKHNPTLKGKPIAIAGNPEERKGIIVTSSYEARALGVKTTMPLFQAQRLCPHLIVLRPNFNRYREASSQIFRILTEYTSVIEPVSIDEGYMDVTDSDRTENPLLLAREIQQRLVDELDLPCSIGIGPNKFLAKMASDMKKPLGITVLRKRSLASTLWPLSVGKMHGVGEKTKEKLALIDVQTIGDLAKRDAYELTQLLGINGERLKNHACGIDPRIVDPDAVNEFKSIGSSQTLPYDTTDEVIIRKCMTDLATKIEQRLKRREVVGISVQLMLRYHNRKTITRSRKLHSYIDERRDILEVAFDLLEQHWNFEAIRLVGVTVSDIAEEKDIAKQLDLFTFEKEIEKDKLHQTVRKLTDRFGEGVFKQAEAQQDQIEPFTTSFQKDFLNDYQNK